MVGAVGPQGTGGGHTWEVGMLALVGGTSQWWWRTMQQRAEARVVEGAPGAKLVGGGGCQGRGSQLWCQEDTRAHGSTDT